MAKIINISDKLNNDKPVIVIGEKEYPVNDGVATVMKFEELAMESTAASLLKAIEIALGKKATEELDVKNWSVANFKVIVTAILAAAQDSTYEEAEARFQGK